MITINNNLIEDSCSLIDPNDEVVGEIENSLSFNDVRLQIKRQNLKGYSIGFKGQRIDIDTDGRLSS